MRFFCLYVFLLGAGAVHAVEYRELEAYLHDHIIESNAPSGVAAVAIDGEIVWSFASGYAHVSQRRLATIDTAYSIASVTKPITAAAILRLVDQGKIDLDAPANRYLPTPLQSSFGDGDDVTVRMLLNHTGGLPRHYKFYYADREKPLPETEFVRRYGRAMLPPGQAFEYSNIGYGLLELIIEHVSKQAYPSFLREQIFSPAEMTAAFVPPEQRARGPVAERYRYFDEPVPFYDFDHRGASAVFATATDLLRFANALVSTDDADGIISSTSSSQMWPPSENEDSYGLGFSVWNKDGETIVHHSGGMPGVSARLMFVPRTGVAVVFLMNGSGDSWLPTVRLLREFQPELFAADDSGPMGPLEGLWLGEVELEDNKPLALAMEFTEDGRLKSGELQGKSLSSARVRSQSNGLFSLMLRGSSLDAGETADYTHGLKFTLAPDGDVLRGYLTAQERPTRKRIGNAVSYPLALQRVDKLPAGVPDLLEQFSVPSVQVSVIRNREIQWTRTVGRRNAHHWADNGTLYNAASLTKLVTAELFMQLMNEGKADLDESMSKFWIDPDLQSDPRHRDLTPRLAFTHTTGFKNWRRPPYSDGVLRFFHGPGEQYGYSGEGFEYVRRFLESKLGTAFESLADEYVFQPAGMENSSFVERPWFTDRLAAPFYADGRFRAPFVYREPNAAGDLRTTSADFARFMLFAMEAGALRPELANERFRIARNRAEAICSGKPLASELCPSTAGHGIAWNVYEFQNERVLFHTGGNDGLRSLAFYVPEREFGMTLFANGQNGFHVIYSIVEAFYDNAAWIAMMRPEPTS